MARILVIEDDDQIRLLIRRILENAGHTVRTASDGGEGLEAFREAFPDLVVTDLILPNVGGLEAMRRMFEAAPEAKVIAISGHGKEGLSHACQIGAVGTIEKPFKPNELVDMVIRVFADSGVNARRV